MKYLLLIITLTTLNTAKAQSEFKIFGDLQIGAGITVSGESMQHATAGINAILPNSIYLRLGADLAFGGSLKDPNALISYTPIWNAGWYEP